METEGTIPGRKGKIIKDEIKGKWVSLVSVWFTDRQERRRHERVEVRK